MLKVFAAFFLFGAAMCALTVVLLLFSRDRIGLTLAAKSRRARLLSINREGCLSINAPDWDRVWFRCYRIMASQGLGHLASNRHSFSQYRWRFIERRRSP